MKLLLTALGLAATLIIAPTPTFALDEGARCAAHGDCNNGAGACGRDGCYCLTTDPTPTCLLREPVDGICEGIGDPGCQPGLVCGAIGPTAGRCARPVAPAPPEGPAPAGPGGAAAPPPGGGAARPTPPPAVPRLTSPIGNVSVPEFIGKVIKAALGVSGSIALLMFIIGGLLYLTSGGAPEKIELGKKTVTWAAIGLVVIFVAFAAVDFIIKALA